MRMLNSLSGAILYQIWATFAEILLESCPRRSNIIVHAPEGGEGVGTRSGSWWGVGQGKNKSENIEKSAEQKRSHIFSLESEKITNFLTSKAKTSLFFTLKNQKDRTK